MKHANWLEGPARAEGGGSFAPPRPSGAGDGQARWPSSDERDVDVALDLLDQATEDWCELEEPERARALRAFIREVESECERDDELAAFLGFGTEGHLVGRNPGAENPCADIARASVEALTRGGLPRPRPGIQVIGTHWSELALGPLADVVRALRMGRAVLLCIDPRFPHLGDLFGRAWMRRAPVAGALVVLQGAKRSVLAAAAASEDVDSALIVGTAEELADVAEISGVLTREVASTAEFVRFGEDVELRAQELAEASFGRSALGGQRSGQVARLLVDQRVFSHFSDALLAAAEVFLAEGSTIPLIDRGAARDVRELAQLGLDEGATLILGGESTRLVERDRVAVPPLIFTNVEPELRLFARRAPAPLALLVRTTSEAHALELAALKP